MISRPTIATRTDTLFPCTTLCRSVANLIARAGLHQSAFTGNSQTYDIEGRHDYVRDLCRDLRAADLGNFRRLEDETLAADQDAARARDAEPDDPDPDHSSTTRDLRAAFPFLQVCLAPQPQPRRTRP